MAEKLELALLGNPELHLAGQPLAKFRSSKVYALLYYLTVTRRAQPRSVLAGLFWGEIGEYYARRNFNRTLSDLAQYVGDHLLIERQTVTFARNQPHWLDVEVVENAVASMPTAQNLTALASAADLYRGDFLDGFYVQESPEFEQWVLGERTRLRTNALQLHHTLSHFYAQQGDLTQAMNHTRRILQIEPWREEAHRQLILLLAQSGQRSAALAQYELCRQALSSELNVEPDAETLDLFARIRAGRVDKVIDDKLPVEPPITLASRPIVAPSIVSPTIAQPVIPHNLPGQRTPFVGRETELADITRLLLEENDCRLLTIIGTGGMGKTRLALKVAEQIIAYPAPQPCFADGVLFLPLENLVEIDEVVAALIAVITEKGNYPRPSNVSLQGQLIQILDTKSMLLVLDNFEHLVKQAELLSELLIAAPKVKILVTSRETLGLQEAWFYPLLGLSIPNSLADPNTQQNEYDAVRLFVQCARRTRPDFALDAVHSAVLRICMLVEGMPLGIELAAAWLKVLNCDQIAEEITRGLDFLTARYQNIPVRHRSMRAVMDHSWQMLSADEREAISRLSIFRGRFRQEAAAAITGTSLFTLANLVEKALLRVTADGYYQLHELTRQYAEEKLTSATKFRLCDAHAVYYAGLLNQLKPKLFTAAYRQVWATVAGELDNIRHAWQWIIDNVSAERNELPVTGLLYQIAEVLTAYYLFHSQLLTGQALFEHGSQVLEAAGWANDQESIRGQPSRRAALLHLQLKSGQFQLEMGHYRESLALAERTLTACREFGLEDDLFRALMVYGHTQVRRGARAEAILILEEALALGKRLDSPHYCAEAMIGLGMVASGEGRYADAQDYFRQVLALCQQIGYRPWVARTLTNLGTTYSRQYDYQQAQPYYEQALKIGQEENDQMIVMMNTSNLGGVQRGFGKHKVSTDLYQHSLEMARKLGEKRWIAANLNGIAITYLAIGDQAAAEVALQEALAMGQDSDSPPDTLGSIALLGHLFARRGQIETALKALTFVEQHPAAMARDRLYNEPLLAELRSELPPVLFEEAAAWAAGQALDGVVRWLLSVG